MTIDKTALKALAENTKGWDKLTEYWPAGESEPDWEIGAVSDDGDRYPVLTVNTDQYDAEHDAVKLAQYYAAANPSAILALLAEIERLIVSDSEATDLCDCLSAILGNVAVVVRGPEERKSRHGFSDIPSRVKAVVAERDQLAADNESLRGSCKAMGVDMGKLTRERNSFRRGAEKLEAENEALRTQAQDAIAGQMHLINERDLLMLEVEELRKDAERYRWLCSQGEGCPSHPFVVINDFDSTKCDIDEAIDACMK